MAAEPTVLQRRARHNALLRYRGPDDPDVQAANRDLRAARLADHITRVVAEAPPLTAEQLDRLAVLLRGGPDATA
jgi:hypothetical protein